MIRRPGAAALSLVCAMAASSVAPAGQYRVADSPEGMWVVRHAAGGATYDVLAKPRAKKWRWISREEYGSPAAAEAIGDSLHVLLVRPQGYLTFSLLGEKVNRRNPVDERWPAEAVPVAVCRAKDFAGAQGDNLVAIIPRGGGPAGATKPATAEGETGREGPTADGQPATVVALGVFQNVRETWRHVTDLPKVAVTQDTQVLAAVWRGGLYVLVQARGRRLVRWQEEQWQEIALAGATDTEVLAMVPIDSRFLWVCRSEANPANLVIVDLDDAGQAASVQPITRDGQSVTWEPPAAPRIARLADQLALVWQEGDELKFATCSPAGQMGASGPVEPPATGQWGAKILQSFLWVLLGAMVVCSLALRPRAALGPMILPPSLRPGALGRRLLAAMIDILPFSAAYTLVAMRNVIGREVSGDVWEAAREAYADNVTAVVMVATAILYLVYCVVMECRYSATVGKMAMGLRVVADGGARPGLREVLLRNLVKLVSLHVWFLLAVVVLVAVFTRYRQRLGDLMARTVVVDARTLPPEGLGPPEGPEDRPGGQIDSLTRDEDDNSHSSRADE